MTDRLYYCTSRITAAESCCTSSTGSLAMSDSIVSCSAASPPCSALCVEQSVRLQPAGERSAHRVLARAEADEVDLAALEQRRELLRLLLALPRRREHLRRYLLRRLLAPERPGAAGGEGGGHAAVARRVRPEYQRRMSPIADVLAITRDNGRWYRAKLRHLRGS